MKDIAGSLDELKKEKINQWDVHRGEELALIANAGGPFDTTIERRRREADGIGRR